MTKVITALMLAAPVALLFVWLNSGAFEAYVRGQMGVPGISSITPESKMLAAIVTFLRLAIGMTGLFHLRRMFGEGSAGRPFSALSILSLRRFSWAALAYAVAAPVERTLVILIFTAGNQQGEHMFAFGVGTADAYAILIGLLLVAVAQMFREGQTDDEEDGA
jgi:hypothetical protein